MHTRNPEKSRVSVVLRVSAQPQTRMHACTRLLNVVERLKTGKKKKIVSTSRIGGMSEEGELHARRGITTVINQSGGGAAWAGVVTAAIIKSHFESLMPRSPSPVI